MGIYHGKQTGKSEWNSRGSEDNITCVVIDLQKWLKEEKRQLKKAQKKQEQAEADAADAKGELRVDTCLSRHTGRPVERGWPLRQWYNCMAQHRVQAHSRGQL